MSARDVIANQWCVENQKIGESVADAVLAALDKAGYAVVPKEPTEAMLEAVWPDQVDAVPFYKRMLKAAKEAVPGGASCQSAEHAMPETTPKGEQQS